MNYLSILKLHIISLNQEDHVKNYLSKNYFTIPMIKDIDNNKIIHFFEATYSSAKSF